MEKFFKKPQILFFGILVLFNSISCRVDVSYIQNYYQKIYLAEFAYHEGDYQKCYDLIHDATEKCILINQPMIYEKYKLAHCAAYLNKYEEAIALIRSLIRDHGYRIEWFENGDKFKSLVDIESFQQLKEDNTRLSNEYISNLNLELRKHIIAMYQIDQSVRHSGITNDIDSIDSVNQVEMKTILQNFGYPGDQLIGDYSVDEIHFSVQGMFMHFNDTTYFRQVLYELIDAGEAPPVVLGAMIDSRRRFLDRTDKYLYGIYDRVGDHQIFDYQNLDHRRISIGLPPKKLEQSLKEMRMNSMN